jgi:dihydrofolate synthase / folylpolyglutamate synthase
MAIPSDVMSRIFSLSKMGIKLGLDNMNQAMGTLNIDLGGIRFIHVAGTNGKGSTSAMLQKLICDHNRDSKTGLYTSPHLLKYNERIMVNDQFITDDKVTEYALTIFEKCSHIPLTFFEFTTLLCFLHFVAEKVGFAVVETGLGGRLDATNVINPEICIITSVAMDHTEYLGSTLESIAMEKAGIFKKNSSAVISDTSCQELLRKEAVQRGIKSVFVLGTEFEYRINQDKSFDVLMNNARIYRGLKKSLYGDHQYKNAACAVAAFNVLGIKGTEQTIRRSLETVQWRGRLEKMNIAGKTVYLDVSHNPEGIYSTVRFLLEYHKNDAIHIACGFMKDKDYASMIKMLHGAADDMFLIPTSVEGRQTLEKDYRDVLGKEWDNVHICKDYRDAVTKIMKKEGVILFTGSIFNFEHISKLLEEYV